MKSHNELTIEEVRKMIRGREICWGGNLKLKIYGRLNCKLGKRIKRENRVFFGSVQEAEALGFRPCGHCMKEAYKHWKNGLI